MMLAVLVGAVTFVLPGYAGMFAAGGTQLPALTAALLGASGFITANGGLILAGVIILAVALHFFRISEAGRIFFGYLALKFPLGRLYVNFSVVSGLAMLMDSGVGVARALPLVVPVVRNAYARGHLKAAAVKIESGTPFAEALTTIYFIDPVLTSLVQVGGAAGRLDAAMRKCHTYLDANLRQRLQRVNKLIEPLITLVLGVLLGTVMLALVLPTFELATAF
jgi:type II secretory pathway component PulF